VNSREHANVTFLIPHLIKRSYAYWKKMEMRQPYLYNYLWEVSQKKKQKEPTREPMQTKTTTPW